LKIRKYRLAALLFVAVFLLTACGSTDGLNTAQDPVQDPGSQADSGQLSSEENIANSNNETSKQDDSGSNEIDSQDPDSESLEESGSATLPDSELTLGDPELTATDPTSVQLASGKLQLIEFFAFW
jgi:hypothetical protein